MDMVLRHPSSSPCRDASMMAMRRLIDRKRPNEIKNVAKEVLELPTTNNDFLDALNLSVQNQFLQLTWKV